MNVRSACIPSNGYGCTEDGRVGLIDIGPAPPEECAPSVIALLAPGEEVDLFLAQNIMMWWLFSAAFQKGGLWDVGFHHPDDKENFETGIKP